MKYEPYEKMVNVNSISFIEMYHNIFLISKISSFDFCYDVTRLDNTLKLSLILAKLNKKNLHIVSSLTFRTIILIVVLTGSRVI